MKSFARKNKQWHTNTYMHSYTIHPTNRPSIYWNARQRQRLIQIFKSPVNLFSVAVCQQQQQQITTAAEKITFPLFPIFSCAFLSWTEFRRCDVLPVCVQLNLRKRDETSVLLVLLFFPFLFLENESEILLRLSTNTNWINDPNHVCGSESKWQKGKEWYDVGARIKT